MIIKAVRGSYFGGVVDYVTRSGKYAGRDDARVLTSQGLFSYRTFAAQLAYDAARDPRRTRPVVHLIARAERSLTDAQYQELGDRMLKVAGLEGRAHVKVVHDEPDDSEEGGHLHIVACEVDDEGKAPPRKFWDRVAKREVTAEESRTLPKGIVASRAWDSHLAWRLTGLARDIEAEWGLRRLNSKRAAKKPDEPKISRAQQEHLARTGMTPLQGRLYHEVRAALALPTWDERAAALAVHALVLRPYDAKGRVRGLMVQSINNRKDAVKVSAFEMGGMPKLDASADMPFLAWHPEYKAAINLRKTEVEARNDHWRATQRQFRLQLQDWNAIQKRRDAAYRQYKRDRAAIMARFDKRLADEPQKAFHRQIRSDRSDELARAKATRDFALIEAGAKAPRPNFADFVAQRAAQGDAAAVEVHKDLLGKVSQVRREALDQHKVRIAKLAEAARALRADAIRLQEQFAWLTAGLRDRIEAAQTQAARIKAVALNRSRMSAMKLAKKARRLAEQLVERLDRAGHRIRVVHGHVSIDRFKPDRQTQALMSDPAHLAIFQNAANTQNLSIALLRDAVGGSEALAVRDGRPEIARAILKTDMQKHLRWQAEPEVQAILADLHKRREQKTAQTRAERQRIQDKQIQGGSDVLIMRKRERHALEKRAADVRARLVAAAQTRLGDSRGTGIYLSAWQSALQTLPIGTVINADRIRAIEVAAIGQLLTDKAGFDDTVIKKLIEGRSPAMAIVGADGIDAQSINALFEAALLQPGVRQRADESSARAVELAERKERDVTITRMEKAAREGSDSDRLWLKAYDEVLSEHPVDAAVTRDDLYGAIDRDVAVNLLRGGLPWIDVRRSLARLSPLSPTSSQKDNSSGAKVVDARALRQSFNQYVDATIAEVVEMLPPADRTKRHAERQAWIKQQRYGRYFTEISAQDDEYRETLPDTLPTEPPGMLRSVSALDPRQMAMLDLAPHPPPPDITLFFGDDGQPVGALQDLLADVRVNRADYEIRPDGQLTAPAWAEDDQKNLLSIQQHHHIRALLLQAFAQDAGRGAGVHRAASSEWER